MAYRYAIVGMGAVGGLYGAKLQRAGFDVHFLARSDCDFVRQHGLRVRSPEGDFTLPHVHVYNDARAMPPCDVAIVTLKTTQNAILADILPRLLQPNGFVLVLQNGLGIEQDIASIVGGDRVMGGLCFLCSNKTAPGEIHHLDYGTITLGDYAPNDVPQGITDRMQRLAADFRHAGIACECAEDLLLARWQKLVWNVPFNSLSVILNARTDEMMADPRITALVADIMAEVALGAKTCDREIHPTFLAERLEHTRRMHPYRTSMKIDYDNQRPLEIEAIVGNPLRVAQARGVRLPRIATLYAQLCFLDTRNCR